MLTRLLYSDRLSETDLRYYPSGKVPNGGYMPSCTFFRTVGRLAVLAAATSAKVKRKRRRGVTDASGAAVRMPQPLYLRRAGVETTVKTDNEAVSRFRM